LDVHVVARDGGLEVLSRHEFRAVDVEPLVVDVRGVVVVLHHGGNRVARRDRVARSDVVVRVNGRVRLRHDGRVRLIVRVGFVIRVRLRIGVIGVVHAVLRHIDIRRGLVVGQGVV